MSISVSGPSIFGAEVSTMKQRAAQRRVSVMHCALLRGFRIVFKRWSVIKNEHRGALSQMFAVKILRLCGSVSWSNQPDWRLFVFFQFFCYDGINTCNGCDVDDIAHRTFDVGEVDRFVQSHLDRSDYFCFAHSLNQLVSCVCWGQVREYQRIDIFPFQTCERLFFVSQRIVTGDFHLHFAINCHFRIFFLHVGNGFVYFSGASFLIRTEVGVWQHGHNRLLVE